MNAFMNSEVIAGCILAFYFFARAATSLFDRKNATDGNGKIADATYKFKMCTKVDALAVEVAEIKKLLGRWDDKVQAGTFTSPWTEREVAEALQIIRRIERNLL